MTLRTRLLLYLLAVHGALAVLAVWVLRHHRGWLIAAEILFLVSAFVGYRLVRNLFAPLRLLRTGAELIQERDFTSRFREVGQPELDTLVQIYNRMIDELRRERLRAREQHELLEQALGAAAAGLLLLDFGGRVEYLNSAAAGFLGVEREAAQGKLLTELTSPLAAHLATLEPDEARVVPLVPAGRRRLRGSRGEFYRQGVARTFFLVEEITAELHASEKAAYGKVIRLISHEVNNSVGAVRSLLESSRHYAGALAPEDQQDFSTAVTVAGRRLAHLAAFTEGFAEVVRLPPPETHPHHLGELLQDLVQLFQPELTERRIDVRWHGAPAEAEPTPQEIVAAFPVLSFDKNQMEQVLINAFKNALEAMGEDGTLHLTLGRHRGRPYLAVGDTGPGLGEDARRQLFTPFFSTKRDGRGLGLTVIREVLTHHGFDFQLRDRDGGGAELVVRF